MALTKVIGDGTGTIDNLTVADAGTIGSASKTNAITIASSGLVQLTSTGIGAGSQVFQVIDDGATLFQIRSEDGNVSFPQAGAGIYLGVTSGNSANLLNDFEQGSWTPTNGGNTTYGSREGLYIKVGNAVFIFGIMEVASIGTGDTREISGLPFASTRECTIPLSKLEHSSFNFHSAQLRTSGSSLFMSAQTSLDAHIAVNQNYFQNSTVVQFSGTYITS